MDRLTDRPRTMDHDRAFDLLPWLVNGTLPDGDAESVERHVRDCLRCRAELKEQRALHTLVQRHPTVHLSAEEGYERVRDMLDTSPRIPAGGRARAAPRWRAPALAAAAAVCAAVGGAVWVASSVDREDRSPQYATLADETAAAPVRLDVVFSDGTTEEGMRSLLAELDASIVGGPTALGRYTLQLHATDVADAELDALLRELLEDARVRFAGRTYAPATPATPAAPAEPVEAPR